MANLFYKPQPKPMDPTTDGWAEFGVYKQDEGKWIGRDSLSVYTSNWKHPVHGKSGCLTLSNKGALREFYSRCHAEDKYGTGGHNWYMTTRFDVWLNHPDGFIWYGKLITGPYGNGAFKIHRTRATWLGRRENPPRGKRWIIRANKRTKTFRVKGQFCATYYPDCGFVYAKRLVDLELARIDLLTKIAFEGYKPDPFKSPYMVTADESSRGMAPSQDVQN